MNEKLIISWDNLHDIIAVFVDDFNFDNDRANIKGMSVMYVENRLK